MLHTPCRNAYELIVNFLEKENTRPLVRFRTEVVRERTGLASGGENLKPVSINIQSDESHL